MKDPWPVHVPLIQDELLSSWLIRTAFENGSYPLAWTWHFWRRSRVWTLDIDRFCSLELINAIVSPKVTKQELINATLYPSLLKIVSNDIHQYKKSWPWVTTLGARNRDRTGGLRYCPECLKSPPI